MKSTDIINFAKIVGKSKKIKRTGWVREGVVEPESVAEHSFRLIVLAMTLGDYFEVDKEKLIKMAIIHDLGETSTGDLVVERGIVVNDLNKRDKEQREEKAISELFQEFSPDYKNIFREMIERKSKEALLFWQLDKLEMAMQAKEYEEEQDKVLTEFIENATHHITDPLLKEILHKLSE